MARHSNGQDNYRVAGWVIAVAVVVVVAIAALLIYLLSGSSNNDSGTDSSAANSASTSASAGSSVDESDSDDADTAAENDSTDTEEPTTSAPETSAPETTSEQPSNTAVSASDTLILLDTSDGLADRFQPVTQALADTARAVSGDGHSVALWNYSSPLNPGVSVGFRNNLGFGDGEEAATTLTAFGTGGVPQSRSAVIAAADTAADRAAETGETARVLLVTTGTDADMDDASFTQGFEQAAGENVELSVIHIGPGEPDSAIEDVASNFDTVDGTDSAAVADALKAAAGA